MKGPDGYGFNFRPGIADLWVSHDHVNKYFWLANFHSLKSPLIMCQISFLTRLLLLTLPDNTQPLEYHSWIKGTVLESPKRSEWKRQWFQHVSTVKDPPW
jgi:hypothetical protein